jgi:hypothetical protein
VAEVTNLDPLLDFAPLPGSDRLKKAENEPITPITSVSLEENAAPAPLIHIPKSSESFAWRPFPMRNIYFDNYCTSILGSGRIASTLVYVQHSKLLADVSGMRSLPPSER